MGTDVPDLRRKLELLRRHGPYRTPEAIAEKLGVAASTVRGYLSGSSKSSSDSLPRNRLLLLIDLFQRALPQTFRKDEVSALVLGDVVALEDAFRVGSEIFLEDILAREARRDRGLIHRSQSIGLVEYDRTDDEGCPSIRLGERFLLEFEIERSGFLLALQNAQQTWWVLPFADGAISPRRAKGSVLIPGIKDARFVYMKENNHAGQHRFVLFVSPVPFPFVIRQAAEVRKSLEWQMLRDLARHHASQPKHLTEIHLIDIDFVRS